MAVTEIPIEILTSLGSIALYLQAIGAIILVWIIIMITNWLMNRKRLKELYKIKDDIARIEGKIDRLLTKKK